jgi:hypothetical protein
MVDASDHTRRAWYNRVCHDDDHGCACPRDYFGDSFQ